MFHAWVGPSSSSDVERPFSVGSVGMSCFPAEDYGSDHLHSQTEKWFVEELSLSQYISSLPFQETITLDYQLGASLVRVILSLIGELEQWLWKVSRPRGSVVSGSGVARAIFYFRGRNALRLISNPATGFSSPHISRTRGLISPTMPILFLFAMTFPTLPSMKL